MSNMARRRQVNGEASPVTYGADPNNGHTWESNSIFGCLCDEGYTGYDCSRRVCDQGDDPMTQEQLSEIQVFRCIDALSAAPIGQTYTSAVSLDAAAVSSHSAAQRRGATSFFRLRFREQTTENIIPSDDVWRLKQALEQLKSIGSVDVTFHNHNSVCAGFPGSIFSVTFRTEGGGSPFPDLHRRSLVLSPPPVRLESQVGVSIDLAMDQVGQSIEGFANRNSTTENSICSDRGLCNERTGICECFRGYTSAGANDLRRACGTIAPHQYLRAKP